jgi:outer membrane protein TolC
VVVRGTQAAFEAGEATVTDLNDAFRAAFETEVLALDLQREALAAERNLEAALGRPLGARGVR